MQTEAWCPRAQRFVYIFEQLVGRLEDGVRKRSTSNRIRFLFRVSLLTTEGTRKDVVHPPPLSNPLARKSKAAMEQFHSIYYGWKTEGNSKTPVDYLIN